MRDETDKAAHLRMLQMRREWRQLVRRYSELPPFWALVKAEVYSRERRQQPAVVNLSGRKPKELRPNEVYIGRAWAVGGWHLPHSKWANPYSVKRYGRSESLARYERRVLDAPDLMAALPELSGKTLACWCAPEPCHGDVLSRLVAQALRS
jgi:hypothetical protein